MWTAIWMSISSALTDCPECIILSLLVTWQQWNHQRVTTLENFAINKEALSTTINITTIQQLNYAICAICCSQKFFPLKM